MGSVAAAALSGLLLALSFPPFRVSPVAWVALAPLMGVIVRGGRPGALTAGFIAGLLFRLLSMSWFVAAARDFADLSLPAAVSAWLLLSACLALQTGLFAAALRRGTRRYGPPGLLLAPFLWVAITWVWAALLAGFHWNPLAASQAERTALAGVVAAAGAPGLSFLMVGVNAMLASPLARRAARGKAAAGGRGRGVLLLAGALVALLPLSGLWIAPGERWPEAGPRRLRLRLVSPGFPRGQAWTPRFQREALSRLAALSRAGAAAPDLVLWPESALPFPLDANPPGALAVRRLARSMGAAILLGSPGRRAGPRGVGLTNSAYLVDRDGRVGGRYDKRRRVPFGEYLPLRPILSRLPGMDALPAAGDLAAGKGPAIFRVGGVRAAPLICYEAIFGDLAAEAAEAGGEVIVNLTNDAWLGEAGAAQHFAMASLRGVERGVPLVRVSNGGRSALVTPDGAVRCALGGRRPAATDCALRVRRPPRRPLQRAFPPACALLSLAALALPVRRGALPL